MTPLTPILSIPFLLSLGISLILIGFVGVFFYQKITEQNHKIASMVDLISTMAEELNYIRSRIQSGGAVNTLPTGSQGPTQIPLFNTQPAKSVDLIDVSDDEDHSDDEEEEDDDDEDADDEDEDDDEDDDEQENVRVINISDSFLHSVEESGEVEEIPSEDNEDIDDSSEDEDDLDDDKTSVTSEAESKVEVVKLNKTVDEAIEFEPESLLEIDASLLKSIHMTFPTDENIDYKKLSLNKLRQIVSDKNLSSDSSKLKKQDLLKLLGVE